MHGNEIARQIHGASRGVLIVEAGSLYPALKRMRRKGWLRAEWRRTPQKQRARYYTITPLGHERLRHQRRGFEEMVAAIERVMYAS